MTLFFLCDHHQRLKSEFAIQFLDVSLIHTGISCLVSSSPLFYLYLTIILANDKAFRLILFIFHEVLCALGYLKPHPRNHISDFIQYRYPGISTMISNNGSLYWHATVSLITNSVNASSSSRYHSSRHTVSIPLPGFLHLSLEINLGYQLYHIQYL